MLLKLITSAALVALVIFVAFGLAGEEPSTFSFVTIALVAGYHRNLTRGDGSIPMFSVVTAAADAPRVRYTVWGLPLGPAGRLRVSDRARTRARNAPLRSTLVECLPAVLRWFVRRFGA